MIRLTKDKSFYRTLFAVALPAAFQSLMSLLVSMNDGMMVGRLPAPAMAAVGQVGDVSNLYFMAVMGLVSGGSVLLSQYWGKRDIARIKQVLSIVLTIVTVLGTVVALVFWRFPAAILGVFNSEQAVVDAALPYVTLFVFSFIPYAISQALIGALRAIEVTKVTLITALLALATDIPLNYIFIFGKLGMPAMGVRGAALATLIARMVELAVVLVYTFRVQKVLPLKPRDLFHAEGWLWKDYGRYGLPVGLGDAQWALVGVGKTFIVGQLGSVMMAANMIASQMMTLGMMFCFALANGAAVVIGKSVGAGDYNKTREYSTTIQWMFLFFGIFFAGLVFIFKGAFIGLYHAQPEIAGLALMMITLGAPTMIGTSYHASCFVGINRGAGDSRFVMIVDIICGWSVLLVSAFAAFVLHVPNAWMFLILRFDQCFKWIIAFIRLRGDKWIKNVTRA